MIEVQTALRFQNIDGWLLFDFRKSNELAIAFLEIPGNRMLTRRFMYWIPAVGEPIKIVSAIESGNLDHLPGKKRVFRTWEELHAQLKETLKGSKKIAMEYSPLNAVPTIAKVDAGTVELIQKWGIEVVSSGDLLQTYTSVWNREKYESHLFAAEVLCQTVEKTWRLIASSLAKGKRIDEYQVQQFILNEFKVQNCSAHEPPIVAVNAHSADPHYLPDVDNSAPIKRGDFILIDLFCKKNQAQAVYADITRVGVAAEQPTVRQQEIFNVVKAGRDAAMHLVKERFSKSEPLFGWEVDKACRNIIENAGYGDFFIHRTGHNLDENIHGSGANIDNFETKELRRLIPGTCFTIEPGIYLPGEFGVRLEYDVYIHNDSRVEINGGVQEAIEILTC